MFVKTKQNKKWNQTIGNYKWYNPWFLHSFKSPLREILSRTVERSKTWNVYTGDFMSLRLLSNQVQNYSPVHYDLWSFILSKTGCPVHTFTIYKGITHSSFFFFFALFFFFAFPPSSSLPLPLVLTLLWIAFYFNIFTPNKVKPNAYRCHSSNQHHKIAAWEWKVENGSNRSQRRHWMYLCCVCLSLHWCCMGLFIFFNFFWQYTVQFLQYAHRDRETPTRQRDNEYSEQWDNTDHCSHHTRYSRCQEFLFKSSVNTPFHKVDYMWVYCKS